MVDALLKQSGFIGVDPLSSLVGAVAMDPKHGKNAESSANTGESNDEDDTPRGAR